jgi:hypothetical protein
VWTLSPVWTLAIIAAATLLGYALAWAHDCLKRKAFEATLSETERAQFNDYRLVLPWRNFANVVEMDRTNALSDQVRALHEEIRAERGRRHDRAA